MERNTMLGITLTLLLVGMLTLAFNIQPVKAEVATLAAPIIVDTALTPGSNFTIDITVDDVEKLWGVQFTLRYNTSVLTATGWGLYLPFRNIVIHGINDEEGYVCLGFHTFMEDALSTVDPVPICWIEFIVDDLGTSVLALPAYDVVTRKLISTEGGEEIPHEAVDGFFHNVPPVGGVWVPVDKLGLLAPYIGLASTIVAATVATAIYVKSVKRRKEK